MGLQVPDRQHDLLLGPALGFSGKTAQELVGHAERGIRQLLLQSNNRGGQNGMTPTGRQLTKVLRGHPHALLGEPFKGGRRDRRLKTH